MLKAGKMTAKGKTVLRWASALFLFLASAWSFNIATYNYFAADFPNEYRQAYLSRGNQFFFLAVVFFAGFVWMVVAIIRFKRKSRSGAHQPEHG